MTTANALNTITEILSAEVAALGRLVDLLGQAQEYLRDGDFAALDTNLASNHALTAEIEAIEARRGGLLRSHGRRADVAGLREYLATLPASERQRAQTLWTELETLAGRCQRQNLINSAIVQKGKRHVRHALGILTGQTAVEPDGYGRKGELHQDGSGKSIGIA
jgi:flagellar biosynthesis/type III secretory pathway chaperone